MADVAELGPPSDAFRFGVICSNELLAWQLEVIRQLTAAVARLTLIIKTRRPHATIARATRTNPVTKLRDPWPSVFRVLTRSSRAMRPTDIARAFPGVRSIVCQLKFSGDIEEFHNDDVALIKSEDLAFIVDFSAERVEGAVVDQASYGVWAFDHGNGRSHRSAPSVCEISRDEPVVVVSLNKLSQRRNDNVVLKDGYFKTVSHSYARHLDSVYFGAAGWPANVVSDIKNGIAGYLSAEAARATGSTSETPSFMAVVRFLLVIARKQSGRLLRLLQKDEWNIGVVRVPPSYFSGKKALPATEWMKVRTDNWAADPMILEEGQTIHVFCEQWDARTTRGAIVRTTFDGNGWGSFAKAFSVDVHASYPQLFRHCNEIYCVPETSQSSEVALYRATSFPNTWAKERVLRVGKASVDSTIVEHEGRWWMFSTSTDTGSGVLYVFYAEHLFGPWLPHLANPVKTDIRSARPAGPLFKHNGELFRPAQDCSKSYGGRIVINRVQELTTSTFREVPYAIVEPDMEGYYRDGIHTFSTAGDLCVIDGKRIVLIGVVELISRICNRVGLSINSAS